MSILKGKALKGILIFGGVILLCIGLMGGALGRVLTTENELYTIAEGSTVYDNAYMPIQVDQQASVQRGWDQNYSLQLPSGAKSLGKQSVIYEPSSASLKLFGSGYRFYPDGTVTMLNNFTQLTDLTETGFYKLSANKYLLTGARITDNYGVVSTANYLFVVLDEAGNARFMNDTMNIVSVEEGTLITNGDTTFDLDEQMARIGNTTVDLTTVLGKRTGNGSGLTSTGSTGGEVYDITIRGGNGGRGGTGGTGGTGGIGGTGGAGGNGGSGGSGGTGGTGGAGASLTASSMNGRTSMLLRSVQADSSSLSIDYAINDPFGVYGVAYVLVYDSSAPNPPDETLSYTAPISLDGTNITLSSYTTGMQGGQPITAPIQPDTRYTVRIGYYDGGNLTAPYTYVDTMRVMTTPMSNSLTMQRMAADSVDVFIKLDPSYAQATTRLLVTQLGADGKALAGGHPFDLNAAEISAAKGNGLTKTLLSKDYADGNTLANTSTYALQLDLVSVVNNINQVWVSAKVDNPLYQSDTQTQMLRTIQYQSQQISALQAIVDQLQAAQGGTSTTTPPPAGDGAEPTPGTPPPAANEGTAPPAGDPGATPPPAGEGAAPPPANEGAAPPEGDPGATPDEGASN